MILTGRDKEILEALGKMRFATTGQVARLCFGSRWGANKRLRKLFDSKVIRVWVRSLSEENVYSLTRGGVQVLSGAWPAPRGLDGNLKHLLAINDVRIALALELPRLGGELAWWRSDWELRAHGRERVIPDALFAVDWGEAEQVFALELDHASRSWRRFFSKVLAYEAARDVYGYHDPVVLVVGRADWVERYRQGLHTAGLSARVWFATFEEVLKLDAWRRSSGDVRYSLRELGSLPYGKEG